LFEFVDGPFDFTDVHVGEQADDVVFLVFVVSVNRDDEHVGQQQEKHVK
jgi:hypothetical protein